jgi:hypothetical protein
MGAGKERLGAAQGGDEAARAGLEQFHVLKKAMCIPKMLLILQLHLHQIASIRA